MLHESYPEAPLHPISPLPYHYFLKHPLPHSGTPPLSPAFPPMPYFHSHKPHPFRAAASGSPPDQRAPHRHIPLSWAHSARFRKAHPPWPLYAHPKASDPPRKKAPDTLLCPCPPPRTADTHPADERRTAHPFLFLCNLPVFSFQTPYSTLSGLLALCVCPKTPLYSFQEPLPDNFSKKIPCKISGTKSCSMAFCSRKHGARLIPHGNKNRFLILHGTVTFHTAKPYSVISNPFISDSSGM